MFKVLSQTKQLKILAIAFLLQSLPASSDILSDTSSDNIQLNPIITVKEQPKEEPEKTPPSPESLPPSDDGWLSSQSK